MLLRLSPASHASMSLVGEPEHPRIRPSTIGFFSKAPLKLSRLSVLDATSAAVLACAPCPPPRPDCRYMRPSYTMKNPHFNSTCYTVQHAGPSCHVDVAEWTKAVVSRTTPL